MGICEGQGGRDDEGLDRIDMEIKSRIMTFRMIYYEMDQRW